MKTEIADLLSSLVVLSGQMADTLAEIRAEWLAASGDDTDGQEIANLIERRWQLYYQWVVAADQHPKLARRHYRALYRPAPQPEPAHEN